MILSFKIACTCAVIMISAVFCGLAAQFYKSSWALFFGRIVEFTFATAYIAVIIGVLQVIWR